MHHEAKVSFGTVPQFPYHAHCACGTSGDFASHEYARDYMAMHLSRLQGVNSASFVDETVAPLPVPEPPVVEGTQEAPAATQQASSEAQQAPEEAQQESSKRFKKR